MNYLPRVYNILPECSTVSLGIFEFYYDFNFENKLKRLDTSFNLHTALERYLRTPYVVKDYIQISIQITQNIRRESNITF